MPDKEREEGYLRRFLRTIPDSPVGDIVPGEAPDFVIGGDGPGATGVEFTVYSSKAVSSSDPEREQHSLRHQVVEAAHSIYANAVGIPVDVGVYFDDQQPLLKSDTRVLASSLSQLVATAAPAATGGGRLEVSPELL